MTIYPMQNVPSGISLRDVLPEAKAIGPIDLNFRSACGKWNECETDDLFVAVNDVDGDGHDYAQETIERGAIAVVGERLLPVSVPQFIVQDSRTAYGKICHALAGSPSQLLSTIGVAGTAGKTVTSHLIHGILQTAEWQSGLSSTVEANLGGQRKSSPILMANAPGISNQLSTMAIGRCTHAVVEASSQGLAQHAFAGIVLDAAVVTNIHRNHCALHGNFKNYLRTQERLLSYLKPTGFAVVNADDSNAVQLLDEIAVPNLTFGIHKQAEVTGKLLDRCSSFQTFLVAAGMESVVVRTSTIGKQHVYNCLAATAVGLTLGIDLKTIARGLENTTIPGRLERVECGQKFGVWIDSALFSSHLNGAIAAIAPICEGKLWCVCSVDDSQTELERRQLGAILEQKTERPIITTNQANLPKSRIDFEPIHQVIDGFNDPAMASVMPNRLRAIEWVLSQAQPGDAVLLAGCGHKPIANVSDCGEPINDRQACQAIMYGKKPSYCNEPKIFSIGDYQN